MSVKAEERLRGAECIKLLANIAALNEQMPITKFEGMTEVPIQPGTPHVVLYKRKSRLCSLLLKEKFELEGV